MGYKVACDRVGVERNVVKGWLSSDVEFNERVNDVFEGVLDLAEAKLIEKIERGDLTAIIFYLKTIGKKRGYVEKMEVKNDINLSISELLVNVKNINVLNVKGGGSE